ncbi:MAG: hypothetical protein AB8B91_15745 [Rubripirellula sp.]
MHAKNSPRRVATPGSASIRNGIVGLTTFLLLCPTTTQSEEKASQTFVVRVPIHSDVVSPTAAMLIATLKAGESDITFPPQTWSLKSNSPAGIAAQLSVEEPLTSETDPNSQSDVELRVRVNGKSHPARNRASTAHANGVEQASVQLLSFFNGNTELEVEVHLKDACDLSVGEYTTTVYCTIVTP